MSFELKPRVKKDCFAWAEEYGKCMALNETYCRYTTKCAFYRTKEQMCKACEKSWGRAHTCKECQSNY